MDEEKKGQEFRNNKEIAWSVATETSAKTAASTAMTKTTLSTTMMGLF